LVSSIGDRRFPDLGIRQLNQLTPVGWWTVYRLRDGECPSLHLGGSTISAEVTARAFACYRDDGIWKHDHTFVEVREAMATVPAMMVHLHADEVHDLHRARIYRAF